jgi:catechol 2,3-dioxygenase-like lactoylglutathione lyase family enzyme
MHLNLVAVVVADYDDAITFFVAVLGFELAEAHRRRPTTAGPSGGSWCGRPAGERASCWRRPTVLTERGQSGARLQTAFASSCASTTSSTCTGA